MEHAILNWQDAVARVVNNRGLYAKLLGRFAASQASAPDEIAAALAAGNREDALNLAHTLKGTAANLGAEVLADAAMQLETAIKSGEQSDAQMEAVRHALAQALEAMQAFQA